MYVIYVYYFFPEFYHSLYDYTDYLLYSVAAVLIPDVQFVLYPACSTRLMGSYDKTPGTTLKG